jgi:hypothetical protein
LLNFLFSFFIIIILFNSIVYYPSTFHDTVPTLIGIVINQTQVFEHINSS